MIEIITERDKWTNLIEIADSVDFYHTYDYHQVSKNEGEFPILIKYSEGNKIIGMPLLIRKIDGTKYSDATSVYGYAGPITHNINESFNNSMFIEELTALFLKNNIVSVFSRLNPYIPHQETCLKNIGNIATYGKVVNIDLTNDFNLQRLQYNKRLKTYINSARKSLFVKKAENKWEILEFIKAYTQNMIRVNAKKDYFFKRDYFFELLKCKDFKSDILLALDIKTNKIVGGVMYMTKNSIVQYHLSGVKEEYLNLNPIKLLLDEIRITKTKSNYKYFNLGGGKGGVTEDSLFKFKAGFSNDFRLFKLWKFIANEKIYNQLVRQKKPNGCSVAKTKVCSEYFPCYRCNKIDIDQVIEVVNEK